MKSFPQAAAFCLVALAGAEAFVASPALQNRPTVRVLRGEDGVTTTRTTTTRTTRTLLLAEKKKYPIRDLKYGEESRRYRRDVYTHEDWVKFRSSDRFVRNLQTMLVSGIYRNISKEVLVSMFIATIICIYNGLVGDYVDLEGYTQPGMLQGLLPMLTAPMLPFSLSVSSLGLLLVFRTNQSYKRWDEARKNWGMNINHTRDLCRMASAYYDRQGVPESIVKQDLERVALCTWAFVRAMKRQLSPEGEDEQAFQIELRDKLPVDQANAIINAKHRPNRALQDLSFAIEALPMNFIRKNKIQSAATIFEDNLGSSERLLSSPVPLFYSRHTARFAAVWLFLLPLALYDQFGETWNHIGLIPCTAAISTALFSIEELATQLEEPFSILPMQAFCDKIYNWCTEIVSWEPNDNEMFEDDYVREVARLKASTQRNGFQQDETGTLDDISSFNQRDRLRSMINVNQKPKPTLGP